MWDIGQVSYFGEKKIFFIPEVAQLLNLGIYAYRENPEFWLLIFRGKKKGKKLVTSKFFFSNPFFYIQKILFITKKASKSILCPLRWWFSKFSKKNQKLGPIWQSTCTKKFFFITFFLLREFSRYLCGI